MLRLAEENVLTCEGCGSVTVRRGAVQRYCEPCSEAKDRQRKAKWAREHPLTAEQQRAKALRVNRVARTRGRAISAGAVRGIEWTAGEPLDLLWMVRISHPFVYGLSKNAIYRMGIAGHVTLRRQCREIRSGLALHLKSALGDQKIYQGKVWLDILVQKPNHKGDAVNVIDSVCDAVKSVLGVDDRWYSIRRLDWEISKTDPRIFVGVGQDITEDHRACACCGRVLPLSQFWGKRCPSRECIDCRSLSRALPLVEDQRDFSPGAPLPSVLDTETVPF